MKNLRNFALAAFALLGFAACQQEEFAPEIKNPTHSVTFVAGAPETKTTVTIDGNTAKFAWTSEDVDRIKLYENSTPAELTQGTLTDGIMTIEAVFTGGVSTGENTYVAVLNSANDLQILYKEAYTEDADILVSKAISSFDESKSVQLQFKREVAIAKMTLKGLDAGEVVNHITVSSNADIAGSYGVKGWASPAASSIEISSTSAMGVGDYKIVANEAGEAVVWFTCIPQDKATLTVKVEAADGDTYTKTFSKPITLTRGDVKAFGVKMEKDAKVPPSYTIVFLNSSVGAGTTLNTTTNAETVIEEGLDYVLSQPFTQKTNCYYGGEQPLRVGKSGGAGSLVIALSELGQVPATKIILSAKQYSSGKTMTIGVNGSNKQQPGEDYTDLSYDLDGTTISSITLDTDGYIYVKSITVEYGGTIKTALEAPTNLAVSAEKVVSWDAVDGAASYVLTIGTEEYHCLSNSYNASAIADEYYDVAVVAVPSDTENYKNSAAATLTDAKFGTPTLATPTLKGGAVDEFSVNTTWTVDSRATAGYKCELYNGETKVGDSKTVSTGSVTFDGLDDGVTYTVKVNAIAVEGTKAYAASAVETIDLTTTPASKVSDVTAEGTYTIKNLSVYAIPSTSVAILGDATGYILYYAKEGHGLSVGNTLNVAGPVVDYYGLWEFSGATASNVKTGSTPDYGEPVEATNEFLASFATKPLIKYIHAVGEQSGQDITVGENKLHLSAANSSTDGKTVTVYGFTYGYHSTKKYVQFVATSIAEDPTVPKLSVTPTSKTWESDETDAAVFKVTTNTEGVKDWSVSPTELNWATIDVDKANGTITVTPNGPNNEKIANEATLKVTHSADNTLFKTITLTQKAEGTEEAVVKTYQHVFTKKPSTGNNVTLSGVSWNITATNLNGYNSNNYAGVQFGTSSKNGKITLTSPSAWSYTADGVTVTKIKEVRLWLNLGGTSVTPSVSIGGKAATSDGTKVTQNKDAKTDWTKTTKVTFTPAAGSDTGVIVIDVTSVKAGYICAIEIDAE